jgi:glycosyltransferase involved in cell wall biosynthesis
VPEIGYGAFSKGRFWKEGLAAKYVFNNVDKALVVDLSLKDDIVKNAGVEGGNIDYLPTGYDPNYWRPKGKKEDIVLTVGTVSEPVIKRKGFETFVKAAKYLPDVEFVLVGKHADGSISRLESIAPSNVKFTGFVPDEELLKWYQKAKVYCQLSRYEGLPNALCEAMLCECIPVGTEYCGIPTAIGDTGFYVPYGDPKATAEAIRKALNAPDELRKDVRERIAKIFSLERREEELIKLIRTLRESR